MIWFMPEPIVHSSTAVATYPNGEVVDTTRSKSSGWNPLAGDDLCSSEDESVEDEADRMESLRDPYCARRIEEELSCWPTIHKLGLSKSNTRPIPGSGMTFYKTTDPIAVNGGGPCPLNVDLFRAPSTLTISRTYGTKAQNKVLVCTYLKGRVLSL